MVGACTVGTMGVPILLLTCAHSNKQDGGSCTWMTSTKAGSRPLTWRQSMEHLVMAIRYSNTTSTLIMCSLTMVWVPVSWTHNTVHVSLFVYLLSLSVCLCVCLSVCRLSVCLFVSWSVCLSVCLFVSLSVCWWTSSQWYSISFVPSSCSLTASAVGIWRRGGPHHHQQLPGQEFGRAKLWKRGADGSVHEGSGWMVEGQVRVGL